MVQFDLRLSEGRVLLPGIGMTETDILVAGGKTVGFCQKDRQLDVKSTVRIPGLVVLPGAVDPHVHLGQDLKFPKSADDVTMDSEAAAAGGVTTFLVYLMGAVPYEEIFTEVVDLMDANSLVDFGLHFCISTAEQLNQLPKYVSDYGVSSFKFFMNFRGEEGKYLGLPGNDDGFLFRLLQKAATEGGLICPHAENVELIWMLREQARHLQAPPLKIWNESRPPYAEAEALQRAAYLAGVVRAPLYAVHVSCAESLNAVVAQRAGHNRLFIETCPHYLTHGLDADIGELGKVNPPLRTASDREALWQGLSSGVIDTVGSDHVPRVKAAKGGDIWKASAGFPGVETLLPILISEGHIKRHVPLQRIAAVTASNPAQIFGLGRDKGAINIGLDADFVVVDLKDTWVLEADDLHSIAGYSIYEGWKVMCRAIHTLVRGQFVKRDGEVQPLAGHGKYFLRHKSGAFKEEI